MLCFCISDTDDSLPMTFDDMDDVSLAAEYYMLSSQVDGEQDLLETPTKKSATVNNIIVNGVSGLRQNGSAHIKTEPVTNNIVSINNGVENSILARQLSVVTVKPAQHSSLLTVKPLQTTIMSDTDQSTVFSCPMCPAKLKNKRNFDTHMKRHRGELPFKCDECPKTFQGRRDLETHKRSRHDPTKKTIVVTDASNSATLPTVPTPLSQTPKQKTIILSMNSIPNPLMQGET